MTLLSFSGLPTLSKFPQRIVSGTKVSRERRCARAYVSLSLQSGVVWCGVGVGVAGSVCGGGAAMEVEVKIRLDDAAAHQRVAQLLAPSHQVTHLQENVFFDGAQHQLSSKRMVLRLRFYNGDQRCVLTLKGKAVIIDGISRGSEVEEDIDVALARACVADPSQLVGHSECKLLQQIVREYECDQFVCLGGFRNVRNVYDWEGVKLELDETHYAFGTTYEIECETTDPERFRQLLGDLLTKHAITYRYSTISKFGIFRSGKIGALD